MRVICIHPIIKPAKGKEQAPRPEVVDIDIVTLEFEQDGYHYYLLERFGDDNGFRVDRFAILPDQPEEVIEELHAITA